VDEKFVNIMDLVNELQETIGFDAKEWEQLPEELKNALSATTVSIEALQHAIDMHMVLN
jgi:hypothetical protein